MIGRVSDLIGDEDASAPRQMLLDAQAEYVSTDMRVQGTIDITRQMANMRQVI